MYSLDMAARIVNGPMKKYRDDPEKGCCRNYLDQKL